MTDEEWQKISDGLARVRSGSRDPLPAKWGTTMSDGSWKDRMNVLMQKRVAAKRRDEWLTLKQRWVTANDMRRQGLRGFDSR